MSTAPILRWLVGKQGSRYYVLDTKTDRRVWRDHNSNPMTNANQAKRMAQHLRDEDAARNNPQHQPDDWLAKFRANRERIKQAAQRERIDQAAERTIDALYEQMGELRATNRQG